MRLFLRTSYEVTFFFKAVTPAPGDLESYNSSSVCWQSMASDPYSDSLKSKG